jgi:hypothetical protein
MTLSPDGVNAKKLCLTSGNGSRIEERAEEYEAALPGAQRRSKLLILCAPFGWGIEGSGTYRIWDVSIRRRLQRDKRRSTRTLQLLGVSSPHTNGSRPLGPAPSSSGKATSHFNIFPSRVTRPPFLGASHLSAPPLASAILFAAATTSAADCPGTGVSAQSIQLPGFLAPHQWPARSLSEIPATKAMSSK